MQFKGHEILICFSQLSSVNSLTTLVELFKEQINFELCIVPIIFFANFLGVLHVIPLRSTGLYFKYSFSHFILQSQFNGFLPK